MCLRLVIEGAISVAKFYWNAGNVIFERKNGYRVPKYSVNHLWGVWGPYIEVGLFYE
jgi:hypothetical protein